MGDPAAQTGRVALGCHRFRYCYRYRYRSRAVFLWGLLGQRHRGEALSDLRRTAVHQR